MRFKFEKALWVAFVSFTFVAILLFSYTMYLWIGVAGALREVDLTIEEIVFDYLSNNNASIKPVLSIHNPSSFTFHVSYLAIKEVRLNGHSVGLPGSKEHTGVFRYYPPDNLLLLEPLSNTTVEFDIKPENDVSCWLNDDGLQWSLSIRMHILTMFARTSQPIRLDIVREYVG